MEMKELKRRMTSAVEVLKTEFSGLRTGRATAGLLEPLQVQAYGGVMPLPQLGAVSVPEPQLLSVQVWDESVAPAVEKAIRLSPLGLNPVREGQIIRVPIPELSQERRRELVKVAGQYAEQARVSVRNVRRNGMDDLKKMERDGDIGEDEQHSQSAEVQKLTDAAVGEIDALLAAKTAEIMQV